MNLSTYFADLHIHIGRTYTGKPVKITAARNLTFSNILIEASERKGLDLIGIIDAHSPEVQAEIRDKLQTGLFREHQDGGIVYQRTTCLLGAEIEIKEPGMKPAHMLAFLPTLAHMATFTEWLKTGQKNVQLSTQRLYYSAVELLEKVEQLAGVLIPAHIFTPFKSIYGSATDRLANILPVDKLFAVELGLSSDSKMADQISELRQLTFLTNSDAHSLGKIGREYQRIQLAEPSFQEWKKAMQRVEGRRVIANYGLNPKLGKYYRTHCFVCHQRCDVEQTCCPQCGGKKYINGVLERIREIADQNSHSPAHRPPYIYQVPLEFLPKVGPKTLDKLLQRFGTEMVILHQAPIQEMASHVGEPIAEMIALARAGKLALVEGGAGVYGKVQTK